MPRTQRTSRHSSSSPLPAPAGTVIRPEAAQGPFRLGPLSPGMPAAAAETSNLAWSIAAGITGARRTCPRRACRQACSAGRSRRCEAEFPPVAYDMMMAMHAFLLLIPYETAVARHALWDAEIEARARAAGRAAAPGPGAAEDGGMEDGEAGYGDAEGADERRSGC